MTQSDSPQPAHWTDSLTDFDACSDAVTWAREYPTPDAAWKVCERGDWMLWLAGRLAGEAGSDARRPLVLAACACARLALHHIPHGEDRPRLAIETAERWARGEDGVTRRDVRNAADAARAYAADDADAHAAHAAYAADAARAAAYAADAAAYAAAAYSAYADAAYAAYAADYAADAAAYATTPRAAAAATARAKKLARCAEIVREYYPKCPLAAGRGA